MSPNVSSFVGDLVEMARAFEELPKVQHELAVAQDEAKTNADIIARREATILELKRQIEQLQSDKRSLEVERDNAQFQVLEEQDRTQGLLAFVKSVSGNAQGLLDALTPKPMEPQPEPTPAPTEHSFDPGPAFHGDASNVDSVSSGPQPGESASGEQESSNPVPTALSQSPAETSDHTASADASEVASPSDPTQATASSSESALPDYPPAQPSYAGKRYVDVPHYVSLMEWLAGGGTEELYYAR